MSFNPKGSFTLGESLGEYYAQPAPEAAPMKESAPKKIMIDEMDNEPQADATGVAPKQRLHANFLDAVYAARKESASEYIKKKFQEAEGGNSVITAQQSAPSMMIRKDTCAKMMRLTRLSGEFFCDRETFFEICDIFKGLDMAHIDEVADALFPGKKNKKKASRVGYVNIEDGPGDCTVEVTKIAGSSDIKQKLNSPKQKTAEEIEDDDFLLQMNNMMDIEAEMDANMSQDKEPGPKQEEAGIRSWFDYSLGGEWKSS